MKPILVVCDGYSDALKYIREHTENGQFKRVDNTKLYAWDRDGQWYIMFYRIEEPELLLALELKSVMYSDLVYTKHKNVIRLIHMVNSPTPWTFPGYSS